MLGIILVFCGLISSITSFLILKKFLNPNTKTNAVFYSALINLVGGICAIIAYSATSFNLHDFTYLSNPHLLLLLAIDIALWTISVLIYYPALQKTPASEATIFTGIQGIAALVSGVIIQTEIFSFSRLLGCIFVLIALFLVMFKKKQWKLNTPTLLLALAIMIFGIASTFDNAIVSQKTINVFFFEIFNFGLTGIFVLANTKNLPKELFTITKNKRMLIYAWFNGMFNFITFIFIYNAYKLHVTASQSTTILATESIFIVLFAAIFLKERDHVGKKILAAVIVAIGIYLLK